MPEFVCADQGTVWCSAVELDTPLGARRLLHGPVEQPGTAHGVVPDHYPLIALPYDIALMYDSNFAPEGVAGTDATGARESRF